MYLDSGKPEEASIWYRKAYEMCHNPEYMGPYAWLLATSQVARNPYEAVNVSREALTIDTTSRNMDIFAAALASCGLFDEASRVEMQALSRADATASSKKHLLMFEQKVMVSSE